MLRNGSIGTAGLAGCVAVAAALALSGCSGKGKADKAKPTPEAGYVVVQTQDVPLETELAGRTTAFELSEVRPQVSGVIKARLFTEGTLVRAGQTLYQIDPSLYRAATAQAQANLASASATNAAAREREQRYRPLARIEAVSKQDLTDVVAQARQAQAGVAQNRAALQTAQINLRFTSVPAPISGRIGRSLATTGALVTSGQADPLATIQRLDPIFVDMQQSSAALVALRRGKGGALVDAVPVHLKLEDGSDYPQVGRVQFAEAVVDGNTGTVTLRARFPNPQGLLLPGMYVRASFEQSIAHDAVLVPQPGLSRDAKGNATVMLVGPGDKAVLRDVNAVRTVGDKWLVTGGLKAGDRIITEGLGRIKPGQAIKPVPAGSKPTPPKDAKSGGRQAG